MPNVAEMVSCFLVFFSPPTDALCSIPFTVLDKNFFCLFLYVEIKDNASVPEMWSIFLGILDIQDKAPVPRFLFGQTERESMGCVLK